MSNFNVTRLGQINSAGDPMALFLKMFSGEVLNAFEQENIFLPKTWVKTISNGKSYQFPLTWKTDGRYHVPGTALVGTKIKQAERTILVDQLFVADTTIAHIDEAMAHYDVRGEFSKQLGYALARNVDQNVARVIVQAARTTTDLFSPDGGDLVKGTIIQQANGTGNAANNNVANLSTDADALRQAVFLAKQRLIEKNIPQSDLSLVVRPAQYFLFIQDANSVSAFANRDFGGAGSVASGTPGPAAGFSVAMSNNIPDDNSGDSAAVTGGNSYTTDLTNTVGMVFHRTAIGTVKLLDIAMESEYSVDRQGTLIVSKYSMGHGVLRPEAAVELSKATA